MISQFYLDPKEWYAYIPDYARLLILCVPDRIGRAALKQWRIWSNCLTVVCRFWTIGCHGVVEAKHFVPASLESPLSARFWCDAPGSFGVCPATAHSVPSAYARFIALYSTTQILSRRGHDKKNTIQQVGTAGWLETKRVRDHARAWQNTVEQERSVEREVAARWAGVIERGMNGERTGLYRRSLSPQALTCSAMRLPCKLPS